MGKNNRKTRVMKNINKWLVIGAMLCMAIGFNINTCQAVPEIAIRYFVLPDAKSPNNSAGQQNAMSFMDLNGNFGNIDTNIAHSGALNIPHVLRPVDFMNSIGFTMWDGTNNPTGSFAGEYGKRLGVGLDWKDTTNTFLVSGIWFNLHSYNDGGNNTLSYSGNLGTNTSSPHNQLTFSPTLKGELLDSNGIPTETYYRGESLTNPVNRVEALIRVGWLCQTQTDVTNDLKFFSSVCISSPSAESAPFTESAVFYDNSGSSATNVITGQPYPLISFGSDGTSVNVTIEGQRQLEPYLELSYGIKQTLEMVSPRSHWTMVVSGGLQDGSVSPIDMTNSQAYYRAFEVIGSYAPPSGLLSLGNVIKVSRPIPVVSNGPE